MKKTKLFFLFFLLSCLFWLQPDHKSSDCLADVPSALSQSDPVIQLVSYEIKDGSVEPDATFTIAVTLKNYNAYATAYNITAQVESPDPDFHLADGQVSQTYFQSIGPEQTVSFEKTFFIEKSFSLKGINLDYSFRYSDHSGKTYTNTTTISPKVLIPGKLKIDLLSVSTKATLGSRFLINIRYTNEGILDIEKINMNLKGNILENQTTINLGAVKAGEQTMQDCYVNFTKTGQQGLGISFSYVDSDGNTHYIPENTYPVNVLTENTSSTEIVSEGSGDNNSNRIKILIFIAIVITAAIIGRNKMHHSPRR